MKDEKTILLATTNLNKVKDFQAFVKEKSINLITPLDLKNIFPEYVAPLEDKQTYLENAKIKAEYCYSWSSGISSLADDSGIEIAALGDEPGVYSARYGDCKNDLERNDLILKKLKNEENRAAKFISVLYLLRSDKNFTTAGILEGEIADSPRGKKGWGYEPIFIPIGYDLTIAEIRDKGEPFVNHRGLAIANMIKALS